MTSICVAMLVANPFKACISLIVHNVEESTSDDGPTRKQHDIHRVSSIFQQQFNITTTITKAIRIGQHREKPRLLKITISTESEKAAILRNCTKLRNYTNPPDTRKIYITPDLTPKEQELNKKLRLELKELNKESNKYQIKNV